MKKITALELLQKVGSATMFSDANEGYSLPLEISKKIILKVLYSIHDLTRDELIKLREEIENYE